MLVDFSGFETAFPVWQERVPFDWNKPKQKWFNEPMWSHIDTDFWRFSHVGQSIHGRFNHTCFLFSPKLPKELVPTSEKKKPGVEKLYMFFPIRNHHDSPTYRFLKEAFTPLGDRPHFGWRFRSPGNRFGSFSAQSHEKLRKVTR